MDRGILRRSPVASSESTGQPGGRSNYTLFMVRPETLQKMERIQKFIRDGMTVKAACKRAGLSEAWFFKLRKQQKAQDDAL